MKIFSKDRQSYIEISFVESELSRLPSICVYIDVVNDDFKGSLESVWFELENIQRFVADATEMDMKRNGEALLSSMSPGEFTLKLETYDCTEHIKMLFSLTKTISYPFYRELSLSGCFEIDPSEFSGIIRDFERLIS